MIEKILAEIKKLIEEKNSRKESFEGHIEELHSEDGLLFTLLKNENKMIYVAYSLSDSYSDPLYKQLKDIKENRAQVKIYFSPHIPSTDAYFVYNAFPEIEILNQDGK